MAKEIKFFIDHKEFVTTSSKRTVAELLGEVELTVDSFYLVLPDKTEHDNPGELVEIHDRDEFTTKAKKNRGDDKVIRYKVNGEERETTSSELTVEAILRAAGKDAVVDVNDLSNYYLEALESGHRYEDLQDKVHLEDGSQFLAVYRGKTPVA